MEPLLFTIPPALSGCTVQHVLEQVFLMSRSHISRLKRREGGILKNGEKCYSTARCQEGDVITALISDAPGTVTLEPFDIPLDIVCEDEWLIVVNKPTGLTVHPERSGVGGSVENALAYYFKEGEYCHTVSRLDRGTSGLMTVAKSGYIHERMRGILHTHDFVKRYVCISEGRPEKDAGVIRLPLRHVEGSHYMMEPAGELELLPCGSETEPAEAGDCVTAYRLLSYGGGLSMLELTPRTGKMHQLRVHMAALGCPLVGDWLYGKESSYIDRPALHSQRLTFRHPMTGETVELEAPVPADMKKLMRTSISINN